MIRESDVDEESWNSRQIEKQDENQLKFLKFYLIYCLYYTTKSPKITVWYFRFFNAMLSFQLLSADTLPAGEGDVFGTERRGKIFRQ